jgi:DNA polymerase III subunit delta
MPVFGRDHAQKSVKHDPVTVVKAANVDSFLARPDPARPVVLIFGPDAGLVSERVNALIKASVDDVNDPFSLVRLEAEELSANPARLAEEVQTFPLFGGRRAVWAKAGSRNIAPAVETVLGLPASKCRVVIEAGDLRRNSPLRVVCERARNAAALPCYADTEQDLARLIDSEMRAAGVTLRPDARAMLIPLLGGDRAASRNELRKLALYASGRAEIDVDDVAAVVSAGRAADLEAQLAKVRAAGSSVGSIFFAAQRQLAQLHKWRIAIEGGTPFSADGLQPPLHFRRKAAVEVALKQWNAARLTAAMAELADAVLASRRMSVLADTIAERALLALAVKARRSAA